MWTMIWTTQVVLINFTRNLHSVGLTHIPVLAKQMSEFKVVSTQSCFLLYADYAGA